MGMSLGIDAVLNYKVGGIGGAGAWTELVNVKDVTLNLEAGDTDITTRANAGWRAFMSTLKEASIEFEMNFDSADTGFTAVKDAYFNSTIIGFQAFDKNGSGLQGDFVITNFSRSEPLEDALTVSVTAKLNANATWV